MYNVLVKQQKCIMFDEYKKHNMDNLIKYSAIKVNQTNHSFRRYLFEEIEWEDRLIGIKGSRGVGKTTLMLQRLKMEYGNPYKAIYVRLDHFYFTKRRLFDFIEEFYIMGGRIIFLDEVHRYPDWFLDINKIYNLYHELKIVFSCPSALKIQSIDVDLYRSAAIYSLHEMSFREYLKLSRKLDFWEYSLEDILDNHVDISVEITRDISIMPLFKEYLREGCYPFFNEVKVLFYDRILSTISMIVENDLQIIDKINPQTSYKLRQLLALLADSIPAKLNITNLSRTIGMSRDMLLRLLKSLDRANLIKGIKSEGSPVGDFTKPEMAYLNNSNLLYALKSGNDNFEGTVRETFFMNQLIKSHKINSAKNGDFLVDEKFIFEISGANKKYKQMASIKDSFIVADNIEHGIGSKIPLWMFGYLY